MKIENILKSLIHKYDQWRFLPESIYLNRQEKTQETPNKKLSPLYFEIRVKHITFWRDDNINVAVIWSCDANVDQKKLTIENIFLRLNLQFFMICFCIFNTFKKCSEKIKLGYSQKMIVLNTKKKKTNWIPWVFRVLN